LAILSLQQRKTIVEKENSDITTLCEELMQRAKT